MCFADLLLHGLVQKEKPFHVLGTKSKKRISAPTTLTSSPLAKKLTILVTVFFLAKKSPLCVADPGKEGVQSKFKDEKH